MRCPGIKDNVRSNQEIDGGPDEGSDAKSKLFDRGTSDVFGSMGASWWAVLYWTVSGEEICVAVLYGWFLVDGFG